MAITNLQVVTGYYDSLGTPSIESAVTSQLAAGWIPQGAPVLTDVYGQVAQSMVKSTNLSTAAYTIATGAAPMAPDATWDTLGNPTWIESGRYLQAYTKGDQVSAKVDLSNQVDGVLPVANGGTGVDNQSAIWPAIRPTGPTPLAADPVSNMDAVTKQWFSANLTDVRGVWESILSTTGLTLTTGSFEEGGTVASASQALLYKIGGMCYTWSGALPKVVPANSTPSSTGGVGPGAWQAVTGAKIISDSVSMVSGGTLTDSVKWVTPESFVAVASDITAAIQLAVDNGKLVRLAPVSYTITRTIEIPDGRTIDMFGTNIVAATGSTPLFQFGGRNLGLTMMAGNAVITGTCSRFLNLVGGSFTPVNADYVKQVRLYGVNVSSPTIDTTIFMDKAVRQVFIDSCVFYTRNGIVSNGKGVEVAINKTIVYGATADTDTVGIGLSSAGGTRYYNEGWHLTDCTVDNFANTLDLADVFVFTSKNGYIACNATTAHAVTVRGVTTTTHCREINIDGVIGGKIRFLDSTSSLLVHSKISGEITNCKPGTCVAIGANLAGVNLSGVKFTTNDGCTLASVANGSGNIHFRDISTDSSLAAGIVFNGSDGGSNSIADYTYSGAGEALSLARPVKLSNVPVSGTTTPIWSLRSDFVATSKDVTVGSYVMSSQFTASKDSKLLVTINLSYTGGATGNTQVLGITVPLGVLLPNGASFMQYILPATSGSVSLNLVCTVTADFRNLLFSVDSRAGNQLRVLAGSVMSVVLIN